MKATKLHAQDAAVGYQEKRVRSQHQFTHLQPGEVT